MTRRAQEHRECDLAPPVPAYRYWPAFVSPQESEQLMERILATSALEVHEVVVYGRRHPTPRAVAWHGDPHCVYRYSGLTHRPLPWTPVLRSLRRRLLVLLEIDFNCVLINHYRSGADRMGWHADDEACFGQSPSIASLSLGASRRFLFKEKGGTARHRLDLSDGSLLLMEGDTQERWLHSLPPTRKPVAPRLNLTWRRFIG